VIRALLIAGPTASGKSALALALAQKFGASIVNADSMQVYRDLAILTARPSREEEAKAAHFLFGEVDGATNFSVALWLDRARAIIARERRPLIFVGGTGLYFRALTEGLSDLPAVSADIREAVRGRAKDAATPRLHAELSQKDPATAANLRPTDRQRILRALEIFEASHRPLASMQGARSAPALKRGDWRGVFLAPQREALRLRIDHRFDAMLRAGALDEVAALKARSLDPALPVMRAHGVPHLIAHLAGRLSLQEATELSKRDTRQYAKRQFTWARHQMPDFAWVPPERAEDLAASALAAETLGDPAARA